jgi:hypothetical protein
VKTISHFITYILSNHVIAYVLHSPIKILLNQQLKEGIWSNWLTKIHEYDVDIKPLKVVIGKGLCKFMIGIEVVNTSSTDGYNIVIQETILENSEWYKHIIFYLKIGQFPPEMSSMERRTLKIKTNNYFLVSRVLFMRNFDGILLRCLDHIRAMEAIQESHKGICGGNFSSMVTTHKIIQDVFIGQCYLNTLLNSIENASHVKLSQKK